jgi:hypothetical protein
MKICIQLNTGQLIMTQQVIKTELNTLIVMLKY